MLWMCDSEKEEGRWRPASLLITKRQWIGGRRGDQVSPSSRRSRQEYPILFISCFFPLELAPVSSVVLYHREGHPPLKGVEEDTRRGGRGTVRRPVELYGRTLPDRRLTASMTKSLAPHSSHHRSSLPTAGILHKIRRMRTRSTSASFSLSQICGRPRKSRPSR